MNPCQAISFIASQTMEAQEAKAALTALYGHVPAQEASVIVALGGDGLMLQTLHDVSVANRPIYGMNCGSVGFLMNEYRAENLAERLQRAQTNRIHPLLMQAHTREGVTKTAFAFNEVSLLRQSYQAAKISIDVDGQTRLPELTCDGILVATPAGSTAYNLSARGPILPLEAPLLALTPISPFRPRRWHGALLPDQAKIRLGILEADKRPVSAVADHFEVRDITSVDISMDMSRSVTLLFDAGHSLDERILREQFG